MKKDYNADSIDVHLGLDSVRQAPQIYITHLDSQGIYQIIKEPVDNGLDEGKEGHGNFVGVAVDGDSIWVVDHGRGIPIETHKKTGISTLTTVMTTLSAGGKMRRGKDSSYGAAGGVHGMGVSITNALSKSFKVWTYRDGWYFQEFAKGKPVTKVLKQKPPKIPHLEVKTKNQGTIVQFVPDKTIFEPDAKLNLEQLKAFLDLSSYLHPKIKIGYASKKVKKLYYQPKGLSAYIESIATKKQLEKLGGLFSVETPDVTVMLQWTTSEEEHLYSFVNGTPVKEGGTHVTGLNKAITKILSDHAGPRAKFGPDDLRAGLITVINVNVASPRFSTQTKDLLKTPEANALVYDAVYETLKTQISKNKSFVKALIKRASDLFKNNEHFTASKKAIAALKNPKERSRVLGVKFAGCTTKNTEEIELFLVEGDSAAGSATKARDSKYQCVLPLRGKVLNVYGAMASPGKIVANTEIQGLLMAVGYTPDSPKLKVGKIIIMCDEDRDGFHISVLILSALYKIIPQAFEQGKVYILKGSLYTGQAKGKRVFADSLEELKEKAGGKLTGPITRMKGWGEAEPEWLEELAFEDKTRDLIKILPVEPKLGKKYVTLVREGKEGIMARCELLGI